MATTKKRPTAQRPASRQAVSKRVTKKTASKKPLLIHHRHTFKLVHHSHTSYPLVLFLLLMTGLFSVAMTSFVNGDSYSVNAVVPAAPLPAAATIAAPGDGEHFTSQIITVSGGCPANSYVKLQRNHVFAGASQCQSGVWSVQLSLLNGSNLLDAQAYNVTDQPGPTSPDITVYYDPPVTEPATGPSTGSSSGATNSDQPASNNYHVTTVKPAAEPLLLGAMFTYKGYFSNQLSDWPLTITGGQAPYAVQIDWGDGQTDLKSLGQGGEFDMQHMYSQASQLRNVFTITVKAEDAAGQVSLLQLFTIVSLGGNDGAVNLNGRSGTPGAGSTDQSTGTTPLQKFWRIAGPTYAITVVAAASFWLGEMRVAGRLIKPRFWRWHGLHWRH